MMMRGVRSLGICGFTLLLAACGSDPSSPTSKSSSSTPKKEEPSGQTTEAYTRVIEGTWTLPAGKENPNFCVKKALTEDIYVHAIRPVHPPGTHHTLLTIGDASDNCTTAVATGFIYAAGVGTEGLTLPDGVALKLPAGRVLNLGLHIYNTSDQELTGTSAMEIVAMDPKDVEYEADSVLAGPVGFSLPPHQRSVVTHDCQLNSDQTVYALFPHMHQWGVHLKTTVTMGGAPKVIHDGDYQFNEQFQIPIDPFLQLTTGDSVRTECTYDNDTDHEITFGESSDTEMCFSVLFRYPKQPTSICFGKADVTSN
jgi:hypothetical protein